MVIFIGADHRGFELKNKLIEHLQDQNIRVEDMGPYEYTPTDDYPDFAKPVAEAVLQNPEKHLGIVICGSGVGVSVVANRYKGIYCGLGFDPEQVKDAREHDHINVLAIPENFTSFEEVKELVHVFLETNKNTEEKRLRRLQKADEAGITTKAEPKNTSEDIPSQKAGHEDHEFDLDF